MSWNGYYYILVHSSAPGGRLPRRRTSDIASSRDRLPPLRAAADSPTRPDLRVPHGPGFQCHSALHRPHTRIVIAFCQAYLKQPILRFIQRHIACSRRSSGGERSQGLSFSRTEVSPTDPETNNYFSSPKKKKKKKKSKKRCSFLHQTGYGAVQLYHDNRASSLLPILMLFPFPSHASSIQDDHALIPGIYI